ncbi:MAG: hypothetical protein IPP07_20580 [Holophagales bacterium]|nr:hypothetical protein [Holophagales bacterium]
MNESKVDTGPPRADAAVGTVRISASRSSMKTLGTDAPHTSAFRQQPGIDRSRKRARRASRHNRSKRSLLLGAAIGILLGKAALAVYPMPQNQVPPLLYFPCDAATHLCNFCDTETMAQALQLKTSNRSPRSTAIPDSLGNCSGWAHEWCQQTPALGTPTYSFSTNASGQLEARISVDYDFPDNYCQVWETGQNCFAKNWPMPPSLTYHRTRLMLSEGASQINVPAIFEKGVWMPTVAADCDGSVHTYTITATHSGGYPGCSDPAEVSVPLVVTFPPRRRARVVPRIEELAPPEPERVAEVPGPALASVSPSTSVRAT